MLRHPLQSPVPPGGATTITRLAAGAGGMPTSGRLERLKSQARKPGEAS